MSLLSLNMNLADSSGAETRRNLQLLHHRLLAGADAERRKLQERLLSSKKRWIMFHLLNPI